MKSTDFLARLNAWLTRHPLKTPSESFRASYVEEVMARIRTTPRPSPVLWFPRSRLALALGTAFAGVLAFAVLMNRAPSQMARQVEQDWQVLATVGELPELPLGDLTEEMQAIDQMMLAQAEPALDEEAWIDETLELLNDLDEEPEVSSDEEVLEEWLRELEVLDEEELASSYVPS